MWEKKVAFHSALDREAVLAAVTRETDQESVKLFSRSGYEGERPILSRVGANGFRLRKRIFYRNSFARSFSALLAPEPSSTRIEARFAMSPFTRVFMIMWFTFLGLFEVAAVAITAQTLFSLGGQSSADLFLLVLVPLGMLILGWLLVSFGLRVSRSGESEMIEFVEQTLVARRFES